MDAIFQVHRRTHVERRVIAWMRNRNFCSAPGRSRGSDFNELRDAAVAFGMDIRGVGSSFVSRDELRLLEWIAAVQRGLTSTIPHEASLKLVDALASCASTLNHQEMRLPAPGFYRQDERHGKLRVE